MSQGLRYKFNGSTFSVQTGFGGSSPTPSISSISKSDPALVGSTGHPFAQGDVVKLSGIVGMTELNNRLFVVDDTATNDFALAGEDTTMANTYTSGGKIDLVSFSEFCELTGANQQDAAANLIDVSTICSTAKEFEVGLPDSGTLALDFNAAPLTTVQTYLRAAKISGSIIAFKIVFPNSGGTVIMFGIVQQETLQGQVDQTWKGTASIKLTGPIFVLD